MICRGGGGSAETYERVDQKDLLEVLDIFGVGGKVLDLIESFYGERASERKGNCIIISLCVSNFPTI